MGDVFALVLGVLARLAKAILGVADRLDRVDNLLLGGYLTLDGSLVVLGSRLAGALDILDRALLRLGETLRVVGGNLGGLVLGLGYLLGGSASLLLLSDLLLEVGDTLLDGVLLRLIVVHRDGIALRLKSLESAHDSTEANAQRGDGPGSDGGHRGDGSERVRDAHDAGGHNGQERDEREHGGAHVTERHVGAGCVEAEVVHPAAKALEDISGALTILGHAAESLAKTGDSHADSLTSTSEDSCLQGCHLDLVAEAARLSASIVK